MTQPKIAITLPSKPLVRARLAGLRDLLRDLVVEHGKPTRKEEAWARRVMRRRRKS